MSFPDVLVSQRTPEEPRSHPEAIVLPSSFSAAPALLTEAPDLCAGPRTDDLSLRRFSIALFSFPDTCPDLYSVAEPFSAHPPGRVSGQKPSVRVRILGPSLTSRVGPVT